MYRIVIQLVYTVYRTAIKNYSEPQMLSCKCVDYGQDTPSPYIPLLVILSVSEESLKALAGVEILLRFAYQDDREGSCSG